MENLTKYNSLLGLTIYADGWSFDNGGTMCGIINGIIKNELRNNWEVKVDKKSEYSLDSFSFTQIQMDLLLVDKKLPIANKFLNSGTNASIS